MGAAQCVGCAVSLFANDAEHYRTPEKHKPAFQTRLANVLRRGVVADCLAAAAAAIRHLCLQPAKKTKRYDIDAAVSELLDVALDCLIALTKADLGRSLVRAAPEDEFWVLLDMIIHSERIWRPSAASDDAKTTPPVSDAKKWHRAVPDLLMNRCLMIVLQLMWDIEVPLPVRPSSSANASVSDHDSDSDAPSPSTITAAESASTPTPSHSAASTHLLRYPHRQALLQSIVSLLQRTHEAVQRSKHRGANGDDIRGVVLEVTIIMRAFDLVSMLCRVPEVMRSLLEADLLLVVTRCWRASAPRSAAWRFTAGRYFMTCRTALFVRS